MIPCLLMDGGRLWKTVRFAEPAYVGDPINTARLFNDKQVDEIILLDIGATRAGRPPCVRAIGAVAEECFAPLCYGGGVRSLSEMHEIFACGVEKIAINSAALSSPGLVEAAATRFGSQSVVASIDVRRGQVVTHGATRAVPVDPVEHARNMASLGAGEILLTSVDREGTMSGFDAELIGRVSQAVDVPVIAHGGAASLADLAAAANAGASAVAAGSLFVMVGRYRAVLVSYPAAHELDELLP